MKQILLLFYIWRNQGIGSYRPEIWWRQQDWYSHLIIVFLFSKAHLSTRALKDIPQPPPPPPLSFGTIASLLHGLSFTAVSLWLLSSTIFLSFLETGSCYVCNLGWVLGLNVCAITLSYSAIFLMWRLHFMPHFLHIPEVWDPHLASFPQPSPLLLHTERDLMTHSAVPHACS